MEKMDYHLGPKSIITATACKIHKWQQLKVSMIMK